MTVTSQTSHNKYNPVTEGPIGMEMLLFFFPILMGSLFQQIYNTADTLIVGRYLGKIALSAVGASSGMIVMLVVGFFTGLSSGASVLAAQYYGARDTDNVQKTIQTVTIFSLLVGAAIGAAGILLAPQMLALLQAPKETVELSIIYLRVYFMGMIGNMLYNTGSGLLRALGDSRSPFIFLVVCCLLNILLDLIFILTLGMGVFGAGLATILSQAVSAVLVMAVLMKQKDAGHLKLTTLQMDGDILKRTIRIGLPAGMQAIMYGISNIIIQVAVNNLGTDHVAAWATYYKIDGVFWMTVSAFATVGATFVGQNFGAGEHNRVKKCVRINLLQSIAASLLISIAVYAIAPWLFPLFSKDVGVNRIGVAMMRYLVPFYVLYVPIEVLSGDLRGVGDTLIPMLICGIGVCLLRSAWILIMMPIHNDMYTMMVSYPISWIVSGLAFAVYTIRFSKLRR